MEKEKKSNGAILGLIVITIILIIGGIYIWISNKNSIEKMKKLQAQYEAMANQDAAALNALEQDSKATDTNTGVDVDAVN